LVQGRSNGGLVVLLPEHVVPYRARAQYQAIWRASQISARTRV